MRNKLSRYLGKSIIALLIVFTACEDGEEVFDQIRAAEQRGAILRTVNLVSNELPIGDPTGNFTVDLEIQDQENGTLVSSLEVFVGFLDNTEEVGPGTDVPEAMISTISSSEFTTGEFGLPRTSYSITLPELLSFVGRTEADITGGDQFPIRFELVLTDGRRFSNDDNSGTITGSYFSSPFLYTPTVICPVPEDFFAGTYEIIQQSGSAPFGIGDGFSQVVEITANGTNRQIPFSYDPGGFGSAYTFSLDLVCGVFSAISGTINSGSLGCDGSSIGQTGSTTAITTYDVADGDDEFLVTIEDFNPDGGCGGTYEAVLLFRKQ